LLPRRSAPNRLAGEFSSETAQPVPEAGSAADDQIGVYPHVSALSLARTTSDEILACTL
jgi:hypothetical protein